ncbi:MAG TPA: hypothetical protein VK680_10825 [Solirubrobacteraceae bacterium]|nr:hypothetical protein [Solirubrobacteraceae bacterium]
MGIIEMVQYTKGYYQIETVRIATVRSRITNAKLASPREALLGIGNVGLANVNAKIIYTPREIVEYLARTATKIEYSRSDRWAYVFVDKCTSCARAAHKSGP